MQLLGGRVPTDRADDWNAIKYVLAQLKDTWDRGDAAAYARCFSADAVYVIFVGTVYVGRADIERSHEALFTKFAKGTTTFLTVLDVRFHGPDTATVLTTGDAAKRPPRAGRGKVQSFTFHRGPDGWECVAFHNTKRSPLMERISFHMDRRFRPDHTT
ncbi:SgcJ/EcaC family oxidoreductase [Actinoplanes utahensis]|nr:hypothetical protein Aut01nite_75530 [Actinoplanes utahensis]